MKRLLIVLGLVLSVSILGACEKKEEVVVEEVIEIISLSRLCLSSTKISTPHAAMSSSKL